MSERRFGTVSFDSIQAEEEAKRKANFSSSNTVILPSGFEFFRLPNDRPSVKIDILPFIVQTSHGEALNYCHNYGVHRGFGYGFSAMICPREMDGSPCPICEYVRLLSWQSEEDRVKIRKLRVQQRQIHAIRWLDGPDNTSDKLYLFDSSTFLFGDLLKKRLDSRDLTDPQEASWNKFADLYEGMSLKLSLQERSAGDGQVSFVAITSVDFKPRAQQYDESWLDRIPDLSTCIKARSYDEIKKTFDGGMESVRNNPYSGNSNVYGGQAAQQFSGGYSNGGSAGYPHNVSPNYNQGQMGYGNPNANYGGRNGQYAQQPMGNALMNGQAGGQNGGSYDITSGYNPMVNVQRPTNNQAGGQGNIQQGGQFNANQPMSEDDIPF